MCLVCMIVLCGQLIYLALTMTGLPNIFVGILLVIIGALGIAASILGMFVVAGSINVFRKGLQDEIKQN